MLTIMLREALSLVASRRVTVYRHAQISTKLALRILQYHHESTSVRLDRPWASHSITRRQHTSLQEGAHTPSRCACTMGVSTNTPRHPLTLVTPQAAPSRRGTRHPSQVEESTPCVCICRLSKYHSQKPESTRITIFNRDSKLQLIVQISS